MCWVLSICIVLFFTACNGNSGGYDYQRNERLPQMRAEMEQEYAAWKELNIKDYQFVYSDENGSLGKITVKDGIFHESTGKHTPYGDAPFKTIDELFEVIEDGLASDNDHAHHSQHIRTSFSVRYHPQYHYPEYYSVIYVMATSGWGGNGWSFDVSRFSRLEDLKEETWQPNKDIPRLLAEWEANRAAWQALNIQNYQYHHQQCYDPDSYVYWDYRSRVTIRDGSYYESVGISPAGFRGATETMDTIFNEIYGKFEIEMYPGWDYEPRIGMYFTVNYDPRYHFPVYFEYGNLYDDSMPYHTQPGYSIRISEFKTLK